jgi:hypothetical protein
MQDAFAVLFTEYMGGVQSWHLDLCVYLVTMYTVYYIWLCNVWEKILPRLNFNIDMAARDKAKFEKLHNKEAKIGDWGKPNDEDKPNDQVFPPPLPTPFKFKDLQVK